MLNFEAAGGGGGTVPQLNSTGSGVWNYTKALQGWLGSTVKVGNTGNSDALPAAASSIQIAAQKGLKQEVRQDPVSVFGGSSNNSRTSTTRSTFAAEVMQPQPLGKKAAKRWDNHKKDTCKCAVCLQHRGELKSSWYKHDQLSCACAVCRQSRGQPGPRGGGKGPSAPSVPSTRASWVAGPEPSVDGWACSRELPRSGAGQLEKPTPFGPSQRRTALPSRNNVLNSSLAPLPVRPESCITTGIPFPWQQKLANLAKERTGCSSEPGISPLSSSLLAPAQTCESEVLRDLLPSEQRSGCSYHLENRVAEQRAFQSNLSSNSRWSGRPNADCACSTDFTGSSSDGLQHCINDCVNVRQSCGHPAVMSHNCCTGPFLPNTVNRRQDGAGRSTGFHRPEAPLLAMTKMDLQLSDSWESVKETPSAISAVTERDRHWSTHPNLGDMADTKPYIAGLLPDRYLSLGQSTSFLGDRSSSMAHVQPDAASYATIFTETDFKPVYVSFRSSNSPGALSCRSSSVAQFPFGLEVQAEAEDDTYQPVKDLRAPIHTRSISFNFDEGTTESSSPPCDTTSTTSILNEKDNCSPVMDVDSGDIVHSAKPQGSLETLMTRMDVDAEAQATEQQVQSGRGKGDIPGKSVRHNSSKRLANPDDSHVTVHQKRAKREVVSQAVPKWCQLIQSKYDHFTIRKIYIKTRVSKRCPQSPVTKVLEKNVDAGRPTLRGQGKNLEGESQLEGSIAISNMQSTGPTNVRGSSNWNEAEGAFFPARSEKNEEKFESMLNKECTRKSLNSKRRFETSSETDSKDSARGMKIRKLQCAASVVTPNDNIHNESETREVEMGSSLSESPDSKLGLPSRARNVDLVDICASDDQAGRAVQLADPLTQNILVEVSHGFRGMKRSRTGLKSCSEGRQRRLDPLRHLIPQLEGTDILQPLEKRFGDRGASAGMSTLVSDVESSFKVDPARTINFSRKPLKLSIEVLLPESMKAYYLTKILRARIPALTIWSIDLLRCMARQSSSLLMVQSHALVPREHSSLCSPPRVCRPSSYVLRRALRKQGKGVNPSESQLGILQAAPSEISSENINFGTRIRIDEEFLRFCHVLCAKIGFLLPHDRITFYVEDLLSRKPVDGMIEGASDSSTTSRKYCLDSLLRDIGLNIDLGGTKVKQEKMTAFEQQQQSVVQEMRLIPLRNISYPCWIDKPLNVSIRLIFPIILLKKSLPRLLLSSAVDMCIISRKQDRTTRRNCKQPTQYSTGKDLEDDIKSERLHRAQIDSDSVAPEGFTSPSANVVKPIVDNFLRHEWSLGSSAFHDKCSTSIQPRSLQTPSANSFQDLLKSVDNNASRPLCNTSESRIDPRRRLHQVSSNEWSGSIPHLNDLEGKSEQRNNGPTSAAVASPCNSTSILVRRRGCPKGGWPKKHPPASKKDTLDRNKKYSLRSVCKSVGAKDPVSLRNRSTARRGITKKAGADVLSQASPVDPENKPSQRIADEAEIEVVQHTNISSSTRRDSEFKMKLKACLDKPFQMQELKDLERQAFLRKPLLRLRETRHRVLHVATKKEGLSYLDYHPDLARKLADAAAPEERLRLLRGFFFWLQHSCISGSLKPWAPDVDEDEEIDDDCMEISKERFATDVNPMAPEAKAELGAHLHRQKMKRETNTIHYTPKTRGSKRKCFSQPPKYISKQMKPSLKATVKRERKGGDKCAW